MIAAVCLSLANADPAGVTSVSYLTEWKLYSSLPIAASQMETDCTLALAGIPASDRKSKASLLLRRGVLRYSLNKPDDSASDILEAALLDSDSREIQFELGRVHIRAQRFEEAKKIAMQMKRSDPEDFQGFLLMGECLEAAREMTAALAQYNAAVRLNPEIHYVFVARAYCYHRLQMWDRCLEDTDEALRLSPCMPENSCYTLFAVRSLALSKQARHDDAVACAIRARDLAPDSKVAWLNLWYCFTCAKRSGLSLRIAELCIERFPADSDVLARLAASEVENDRKDLALQHAREAVRLNVSNGMAYNVLGRIAWAEGNWEEASHNFEKACKLNKHDFDARARIALLWSTCPQDKFRNRAGAAALFQVIEREKDWSLYDPYLNLVLACVAADNDDFEEALGQLERYEKTLPKGDVPEGIRRLRELFAKKRAYVTADNRDERLFDLPLSAVAISRHN